ncbi:MAG: hypothetical protein AAGF06_06325 [Pseudomonadota bacterium]
MNELGFFKNWEAVEEYIRKGAPRPKKLDGLKDPDGEPWIRFPDAIEDGVLLEAKNGRQSLSAHIKKQIEKDVAAREQGIITDAEWHFFPSVAGDKGKVSIGPSAPLLAALKENNIKVIIHAP